MEARLTGLVERLQKTYGDRLVSVILYGSAAMDDWHDKTSDLNILCVVSRLTSVELGESEAVFRWWREQSNPPPLLLTPEEVRTSTDCFPMEFYDMQQHRRVLQGADVIKDLVIDRRFYRAQVEHELRAKQIRLRQRAAEVLTSSERLSRLMTDSISTFCVLGRHALILSGEPPRWRKKEIVAALSARLGSPLTGADEILAIRTAGTHRNSGTVPLFERYLSDMEALVQFVDGLEH